MKITVLGTRGSMAVSGTKYQEFGGGTSCYLIETDENAIYLDAGSGIMNSPTIEKKTISIFLTHPHLDHILGFPFFPMLGEKDRNIYLYSKGRNGLSSKEQVDYVFSGPAWPVQMENYPSNLIYKDLNEKDGVTLSDAKITWIEGNHPSGSLIFKIEIDGATLVYATDYEHSKESDQRLIIFAKDCDLLIYDGQYTLEEYPQKRGYGHSTKEHGIEIMNACGCKKLLFTHHDPFHSDGMLKLQETKLQGKCENIRFARAGEIIVI
ncbi:MAG: MBL fold metallo-hydrolase [Lachnospiraceae bacterium]|nr:MBL fold metallo-hydrolase [Lachnospiraceae bacterium]